MKHDTHDTNVSIFWNKLKGLGPYRVLVHHNFWGGKYYESSTRPIVVIAHSPAEATQIAVNNLDTVEEYLRALRFVKGNTTIRAIKLSERYRLSAKDVRTGKKMYGKGQVKAFNADGEIIMHEYDTGGDK